MPNVQRLFLPDTNQSPVHILAGVKVADRLCETSSTLDVIFLVPAKASLTSGALHEALGTTMHSRLVKGVPVILPSGAQMRCETMKTLKWVSKPSVLIAIFASQDMMEKSIRCKTWWLSWLSHGRPMQFKIGIEPGHPKCWASTQNLGSLPPPRSSSLPIRSLSTP